jgi:hypothetical protein
LQHRSPRLCILRCARRYGLSVELLGGLRLSMEILTLLLGLVADVSDRLCKAL